MAWINGSGRTATPEWRRLRRHARRAITYRCGSCGLDGTTVAEPLELDHIIPKAEGGPDAIENLVWLCRTCHAAKTRAEAARGAARRAARGRLPVRPHPGEVPR